MKRRDILGVGAMCFLGTVSGCSGDRPNARTERATTWPVNDTPTPDLNGGQQVNLPISTAELERGATKDAIPAITQPTFGSDWSGVELKLRWPDDPGRFYTASPRLGPNDPVIGLKRSGEARAYPLKLLIWHEIVNDTFDGPVLVTYCPLCGSGMTAQRTVNGQETTFGVSGYLYRNDLVMYDEATGSLWSQIMATAIAGPETGETLDLIPSSITTWEAWQAANDDVLVLRPPPESNTVTGRYSYRDYSRYPYGNYRRSERIGLSGEYHDDRLHPKEIVIGIKHAGTVKAYPLSVVARERVVNDHIAGRPVVVAVAPGDLLVAYHRTIEAETLVFTSSDERVMLAGGSRWDISSGLALDGPHEGRKLTRANEFTPMFFFARLEFNEDTVVYTGNP